MSFCIKRKFSYHVVKSTRGFVWILEVKTDSLSVLYGMLDIWSYVGARKRRRMNSHRVSILLCVRRNLLWQNRMVTIAPALYHVTLPLSWSAMRVLEYWIYRVLKRTCFSLTIKILLTTFKGYILFSRNNFYYFLL